MPSRFDALFSPYRLKNCELRNRFVMPPMQRGFAVDGKPTKQMVDYLRSCAAGGVALIFSESVSLDHPSAYAQSDFCDLNEATLDIWRAAIAGVHDEGAHFILQLWHPGATRVVAEGDRHHDYPTLSPSGMLKTGSANGRAMTRDEIAEIRDAYVEAAIRAKSLGADGVELHCAHGYLLDQFFWTETNLRTDEYGGPSLSERARYPAEVVAAVRGAVGNDFIISCRFSQWKGADYAAKIANTPQELEAFLKVMLTSGVDCFHVSTRRFANPEWPELHPDRSLAGWTKFLTGAPVITVGSVGLDTDVMSDLFHGETPKLCIEEDLELIESRLEKGEFDLVAIGRGHIANNDFVTKVREGRFGELQAFDKSKLLPDSLTNS